MILAAEVPERANVGADVDGNSLVVANNCNLRNLTGLAGIFASAPGALNITNNCLLQDLHGMEGFQGCGPNEEGVCVEVSHNSNLTSVSALSGMTGKVNGSMIFVNNSLENFHGLEGVCVFIADESQRPSAPDQS